MEVRSLCPFAAWGFVWHWNGATYAQTVVVKATFRLTPETCQLADVQDALVEDDVYAEGDSRRSVVVPSDKVPHKPHADVMLVGHAYAPKKQPVRSLMVRLVVGSLNKSIEVWCDRGFRLQDGQLREGPRFLKMPLCWERAAGGPETSNPVGSRFNGEPDSYGLVTIPNLQPPGMHVSQRSDSFAPVCFAPISATWPSRTTKLERLAGKFSSTRWETRPIPEGFDYAYFQAAPPDQQVAEIRPNERIILENLHPDHPRLVTSLPGFQPKVVVERATGERENVKLVADTLRIDTDRQVCVVVWRGTIWLQSPSEPGRILVTRDDGASEELDPSDMLSTVSPTAMLEQDLLADDVAGSDNATVAPWFDVSNGPGPVMPFLGQSSPKASQTPSANESKSSAPGLPSAPKEENLLADDAAGSGNETVAPWFDSSNGPGLVMPFLGQDKPKASQTPMTPMTPKTPESPLAAKGLPFGNTAGMAGLRAAETPPPVPVPAASPIFAPMKALVSAPVISASGAPALPVVPPPLNVSPVLVPPPVVTAPPMVEPIAPASDASRWAAKSAGDEVRLTFGQTAAQAFVAPSGVEQPVAKSATPAKKQYKEVIEVLHVEADSMYRFKAHTTWKKLLAEARPKVSTRDPDEDIPSELRAVHRNIRDVTVIMTRAAEVLDDQGIRRAFSASVSEDGAFVAPVVLIEGDFRWSFDEVETLKVTAGLAAPLAATNKKVKELLDIADDMLAKPLVFKVSAANLALKIRDQFGATSLMAQGEANGVIDQTLLERQSYQKRQFFNKKWLRGTLKVGALSTTAYLPEAALSGMPTCSELRIKAIAELKPKMTADEPTDFSLFVLAMARGLGSSSQWNR